MRRNPTEQEVVRDNTKSPDLAPFTNSQIHGIHHGDARVLVKRLPAKSINTTITSPPYFDLKDYGGKQQLGYGQTYDGYLDDLAAIFGEVHRATKARGSLWIIIDSFRRGQEVYPLPFDLASKLRQVGWSLRDIIIWKKERTLPWIHEGKTKKIFEYILVFGKAGESFRHFPDRLRDHSELRKWWVRYPERYNPSGKALEEIWNFDIPVQGSWGSGELRHYCPLPPALVGRILDLTTNSDDTVLDPFAGSGTVLLEAQLRGRSGVGFELNGHYIRRFKAAKTKQEKVRGSVNGRVNGRISESSSFRALVLKLRLLKFARLLYRKLAESNGRHDAIEHIFVRQLDGRPRSPNKLIAGELTLYSPSLSNVSTVKEQVASLVGARPLSKFGIEAHVRFARSSRALAHYGDAALYGYSAANSHKYNRALRLSDALGSGLPIISPLKVRLEQPDG